MKRKMRQILSVTLSLAVLLSLTACGTSSSGTAPTAADGGGTAPAGDTGGGSSGEKVKISIATTNVDGDPMQDLIYYFQDQVDEILPGRVEWVNYTNSSMGSERELGEMVMNGGLDASLQGPSNITAFAPMNAVRLQDVPFLFKDQDELYAATNEWYRDMINKECEPYGFTTMFFEYFMGQEIENTKRPVTTPEDMVGLKIRVYDSPGPYNFVEACGGLPVAMAFSEVYTSLQQGAIDGTYTAKRTEEYCQNVVSPEIKASVYAEIEAEGVEVNEVSEADYQRFVEKVEAYCYDKMREDIGAEVWDQCTQWLEEYRAR